MRIQLGTYQHYKGTHYQVIALATHTETMEDMVVYRSLDDEKKTWVRPLVMFTETVTIEGVNQPRFRFIRSK